MNTYAAIQFALDDIYWDMPVIDVFGDLNGDGFVGIADLNIVLSNWNQNVTPGDYLQGDPSGDGFVGIEDLNYVLRQPNGHAAGVIRAGAGVTGVVGNRRVEVVLRRRSRVNAI
ncbi:MAG: hypothetical protein R3C45_14890 [Phycisphaerales bacterium]